MNITTTLFYLLSFPLAYGIADMLWMMLGHKAPFFKSIAYRGVISVLLTFGLARTLEPTAALNLFTLLSAIGTGFLAVIAFLLFYKSLQQKTSGINNVITKGLTSVVAVTIVMCIAQQINFKILLALAALIIGLLFLYFNKDEHNKKISLHAIAAGILWGIVTVLYKKHVDEIGSFWFAFILELTLLITVAAIYILKKNEHGYRFTNKQLAIIFCIGLATATGSILNTYAYNYFTPSIISIAAKFAILPPFLFAVIVLKQKLSLQKTIGLLAILLAIYLSL